MDDAVLDIRLWKYRIDAFENPVKLSMQAMKMSLTPRF